MANKAPPAMSHVVKGRFLTPEALFWIAGVAWGVAIVVVCARLFLHPIAHSIYPVIRNAGAQWLRGERLYQPGSSEFLYSPLFAGLMCLFALIPMKFGVLIWHLVNVGAFLAGATLIARGLWIGAHDSRRAWAALALLPLTLSNVNNGQANLVVLGLLLAGLAAYDRQRWFWCGLCGAAVVYVKIYPVILFLLLTIFAPPRMWWSLLLSIAALFAVSLMLQHPSYVLEQYNLWMNHLRGDARRTIAEGRWRDCYLLLKLLSAPITVRGWMILQFVSGALVALLCFYARVRKWSWERSEWLVLVLATLWMVLFGPATEAATYVLIAPTVVYAMIAATDVSSPIWLRCGTILSYILICAADALNAWVHPRHHVALAHAVQPLCAILFLGVAIPWLISDSRWQRREQASAN